MESDAILAELSEQGGGLIMWDMLVEFMPVIIALVGGNGLIVILLNRKSSVKKLIKLNNRQAQELVILSSLIESTSRANELIVDALHDKGVLNGNATEIKAELHRSRDRMLQYCKEKKNNGLFFEEEK